MFFLMKFNLSWKPRGRKKGTEWIPRETASFACLCIRSRKISTSQCLDRIWFYHSPGRLYRRWRWCYRSFGASGARICAATGKKSAREVRRGAPPGRTRERTNRSSWTKATIGGGMYMQPPTRGGGSRSPRHEEEVARLKADDLAEGRSGEFLEREKRWYDWFMFEPG